MTENLKLRLREIQTITDTLPQEKDYISSSIPRTYLLGNGDMGGVSFGTASEKGYILSKGDFWNCGDLKTDAVMKYSPNRVMPLPIGQFGIRSDDLGPFISETLDLYTATVISRYRNLTIKAFISHRKNVLHVTLKAHNTVKGQIKLSYNDSKSEDFFHSITPAESPDFVFQARSVNNAAEDKRSWTSEVAYGMISDSEEAPSRVNENTISEPFILGMDESLNVAILIEGGGKTYDNEGNPLSFPLDELKKGAADLSSFSKALGNHKSWWKGFWERSFISLGDDQLERFYYGSLYLTAACSAPDKLPPGIMGIWPTNYTVKWNGDYHMNYNYIAPFYGVYTANRCELSANVHRPLLDAESMAQEKSRKDLTKIIPSYIEGGSYKGNTFPGRPDLQEGIPEGALFPVALAPYGVLSWEDEYGGYLNQMNNGAFTMSQFASHYLHTFDTQYMKDVFPLLRKTLQFFLKWSEKEFFDDGTYRYTILSGAHEDTVDKNAMGVLASIRNILALVFTAVENGHITVDEAEFSQWKEYEEKLSEYSILEHYSTKRFLKKRFTKTVLPLAEAGAVHRPISAPVNLEAIHPLEQINMFSDEKLLEAARNTVDLKVYTNPKIWRQINCFPKLFTQAVRIGYDLDILVREFKDVLDKDMKSNYTVKDYDDCHGIEKAGAIEFINSMLLFSDGRTVSVFPNWFPHKDAAFYRLLGRGGFETSAKWNGSDRKVEKLEIRSLFYNKIRLVNPFTKTVVYNEKGERIPHISSVDRKMEILEFEAVQNTLYTVSEDTIVKL